MKKIKVLAFYRGKIHAPRGTPIRVFNMLSRLEKSPGIELSVFSWDKEASGFSKHFFMNNNHVEDLRKIISYTKDNSIDIILGYTASALYYLAPLKFLTKAKIAYESHGFMEDEALGYGDIGKLKHWMFRVFFGFCYWLCDLVMTSDGPSTVKVLEKYHKDVLMLCGGVDLNNFRPDAPSGGFIKKDGRIVIGYAGNARLWQGVDFLVDAYRKLLEKSGDFRLVLLLSEKKDFGSNIEVFPQMQNKDVPKFLVDCDILVIPRPSLPMTKIAFPSKISEYVAMGKTVVVSNVGDMGAVVHDGRNGLVYEASNRDKFIEKLLSLRDPKLRARLGVQAAETAKNLSWDKLVGELVANLIKIV